MDILLTQVYKIYNRFFYEHHFAIWQKVHRSHIMVSVGCSQFGEATEHQGKVGTCPHPLSMHSGTWGDDFGPGSTKDVATVSFSTTRPLRICLWALPDIPLLWHMGVILHSSCALWGAGHSGRWSQAHLSTTQLFVPQGLYFLYTLNGKQGTGFPGTDFSQHSGFCAVPLFLISFCSILPRPLKFQPALFYVALHLLSQITAQVPSPSELGLCNSKDFSHPSIVTSLPWGKDATWSCWLNEGGRKTGYKEIQGGKNLSWKFKLLS